MAHDAPQSTGPGKLVIRNIGLLLSGDIEKPILPADTVVAVDGRIAAVGQEDLQRHRIAPGVGIADDVDGVGLRPCGRQGRIEFGARFGR